MRRRRDLEGRGAPRLSRRLTATVAVAAMGIAGCSGAATTRTPSPSPAAASPSVVAPTASPAPTPTAAATLASCPAAVQRRSLHVVHHFAVSPDDITVDQSGVVWVTATTANLLISLTAGGSVLSTRTVTGAPEGVAIDASAMYVAQQTRNAIAEVTPHPGTLITFPNPTTNAGIDGIAIDAARNRLLVPDSPTGQLYAVPLSGSPTPQLIASGLGRPVAATTDSAGDVIVASESKPALVVISPSGARRTLGHFTDLDEVVPYGGLLYVTELDRGDVLAVDPSSGASVRIAVNLPTPQGLAVTAAGTLEIVDSTFNTLYSLPACGVPG
jgi:sugar lactone lactonase YvrE